MPNLLNFVIEVVTAANSTTNCSDPNNYDTPDCNPTDTTAWKDMAVPVTVVLLTAFGLYLCCKVPCIREPVKKCTDPIGKPVRHFLYPLLYQNAQIGKNEKAMPLLAEGPALP